MYTRRENPWFKPRMNPNHFVKVLRVRNDFIEAVSVQAFEFVRAVIGGKKNGTHQTEHL